MVSDMSAFAAQSPQAALLPTPADKVEFQPACPPLLLRRVPDAKIPWIIPSFLIASSPTSRPIRDASQARTLKNNRGSIDAF